MAELRRFEQRTAFPDRGGQTVQRAVDTRVNSFAPALARIGGQILQMAEPQARENAQRQAAEDFAAQGLGKDADGNYVLPDPVGGGREYRLAYEANASAAFKTATMGDAERYLNDLYRNPENFGKEPEWFRSQADQYVKGVLAATPEHIQGQVFAELTREVAQRDLQAGNEYFRRELTNQIATFDTERTKLFNEFAQLLEIGDESPEALAMSAAKRASIMENAERLELYQPGTVAKTEYALQNLEGASKFMNEIRAMGLSAMELKELSQIVVNNSNETVGDYNFARLQELIPDSGARENLRLRLNQMFGLQSAKENQLARGSESESKLFDALGIGQGGMTDKEYAGIVEYWAGKDGVDLMTPEGFLKAVENFDGDPPHAYYKGRLSNPSRLDQEEAEKGLAVYKAMRDYVNPQDGQAAPQLPELSAEDHAFWYHFDLAMENGEANPKQFALDVIAKGITNTSGQMNILREASGYADSDKGKAKLTSDLAGDLGDWEDLPPEVQTYLRESTAQQVAHGIRLPQAIQNVHNDFKKTHRESRFAIEVLTQPRNGLFDLRRTHSWVAKDRAVPEVKRDDGGDSESWIEDSGYGDMIIGMVDKAQLGGLPDLVIGKNVTFLPVGPKGIFKVTYVDGHNIVALNGKDKQPLLVDLGRAADVQNRAKDVYRRELAKSLDQISEDTYDENTGGLMSMGNVPGLNRFIDETFGLNPEKRQRSIIEEDLEDRPEWFRSIDEKHLAVARRDRPVVGHTGQAEMTDELMDAYLPIIRAAESSGNDAAANKRSSAVGRYQFLGDTWLEWYGKVYDTTGMSEAEILRKRLDGDVQEKVARAFTQAGADALRRANIPLNNLTLYASHFFGHGAAPKVLKAGKTDSVSNYVSSNALLQNPGVLTRKVGNRWVPRTVGDVLRILRLKVD